MNNRIKIAAVSLLAMQVGACGSPMAAVGRLNPFAGRGEARTAAAPPAPLDAGLANRRGRTLESLDFASGTLTPDQVQHYWGQADESFGEGGGDLKYILSDRTYIVFPVVTGDKPIHGAVHYSADGTAIARVGPP